MHNMSRSHCRSCGTTLVHTFVDLGMSPLANSYLKPEQLNDGAVKPFERQRVEKCLPFR